MLFEKNLKNHYFGKPTFMIGKKNKQRDQDGVIL